jgi:hypothetical protein
MATPRSVLRPSAASGRRKSIRGFLSFATPATLKRRVVFNEEVYIQEIVDIRDKRMHWNANLDDIVKQAAAIPLPESPAPFRVVSTSPRLVRIELNELIPRALLVASSVLLHLSLLDPQLVVPSESRPRPPRPPSARSSKLNAPSPPLPPAGYPPASLPSSRPRNPRSSRKVPLARRPPPHPTLPPEQLAGSPYVLPIAFSTLTDPVLYRLRLCLDLLLLVQPVPPRLLSPRLVPTSTR